MARDEQRLSHVGRVPVGGRARLLVVAAVALAAAGCASHSKQPAVAAKGSYTVVHAGHPPTSFVFPAGGHLQVVDVGESRSNPTEVLVLDTQLPTNARVTLNPGLLTVNAQATSAKGPFSRKHTYEFRLVQ